jgi:hypothetical protein
MGIVELGETGSDKNQGLTKADAGTPPRAAFTEV